MPESVAKKLFAPDDDVREYARHISVSDLIKFEEALPVVSPGGSISANHGNIAYVSADGDNDTGEVGNISLPYETADAAIAALNPALDGALIILSSTSTIDITDYDHTAMPYNMSIQILCDRSLTLGGTDGAFGRLGIQTNGGVIINTGATFSTDDILKINCRTLTILDSSAGSITYAGSITCDDLVIEANAGINISADVLNWSRSASVGVINSFTYNICPPRVWEARLSQSGGSAPTIDFVYENSYGETLTASRFGGGQFDIESAGNLFDPNKTRVYFGSSDYSITTQLTSMNKSTITSGAVRITSFDAFNTAGDGFIKALDIKIITNL